MLDHEIVLRQYVYKYIPRGWQEHIGRVAYVPYWTKKQYDDMKKGIFTEDTPNYLIEGVKSFLEKMNNKRRTL